MSRVAKAPIYVPEDVEVKLDGQTISVKGKQGQLIRFIHPAVIVSYADNVLTFTPREGFDGGWMQAGTTRSLINQMIVGVVERFTRKLILQGVGYRAAVKGNIVNLSLGFSHPIEYNLPEGVHAECPSQTEIILTGIDKQLVGQIAANLRAYRRPEPYKGKGIRYDKEVVRTKVAKKK